MTDRHALGVFPRARRLRSSPGPRQRGLAARVSLRSLAFRGYWAAVIGAGAAFVVDLAWRGHVLSHIDAHPAAFVMFAAALLLAEGKPLPLLSRDGGGEVTVSWAFSFALLFIAGPAATALAALAAAMLADLWRRKPIERAAFNGAQIVICIAAAGWIFSLIDRAGTPMPAAGPSPVWLAAVVVAATTAFLLNGLLTTVIIALASGDSVGSSVRTGIFLNLSTDGTLLALAPLLALVALHGLVLLPVLLVIAWAVYRNSYEALARKYEAEHDALTGLLNRRAFDAAVMTALDSAARSNERLAVLILDLDGFKSINDRLGHRIGDLLLKEIGARLGVHRSPGQVAARVGGDEFALLMRVDDQAAAVASASDLLDSLSEPCSVDDFPVAIRGSCGIAIYPDHGDTPDALLHQADVAMYRAKQNQAGVATASRSNQFGVSRLALLSDLAGALKADQLVLHYQPQIDLSTRRLAAMEALVRWRHPRFGLLPPDAFIPLAEHTELMLPFTEYVVERALRQSAEWSRQGLTLPIAVNCSARNLHDPRFPDTVARLLGDLGIDARLLELEITENTLLSDPPQASAALASLRALGIRLSIDDFGTGYSSLIALRDLPFDRVKIDRSFVGGMAGNSGDAVIVRSIIELARNLGLETVAEGVEDEETLDVLVANGCSAAQGYLIARPLPPDEATRWMQEHRATFEIARGEPVRAALG